MHLEKESFFASTGEQSLSTQTKRFHNSTNLTNSICSAGGQPHQIYYVVAVVVVLLGRDAVEPVASPADVLFIFDCFFFCSSFSFLCEHIYLSGDVAQRALQIFNLRKIHVIHTQDWLIPFTFHMKPTSAPCIFATITHASRSIDIFMSLQLI